MKMSRERIDRYRCDVCNALKDIQSGWFGSRRPQSWGSDYKMRKIEMCDDCFSLYEKEYDIWFSQWLKNRERGE